MEERIRGALSERAEPVTLSRFEDTMEAIADGH